MLVFDILILKRIHTPYGRLHPMLAVAALFGTKKKTRDHIPVAEQRLANTRSYRSIGGRPLAIYRVSSVSIPGQEGDIETLLFEHESSDRSPVIVFYHGGGFVVGHPSSYENIGRYFARELGAQVYIPDYRLAPEHPFPAAVEDAWSVLQYAAAQHPGQPLIVMGDSAGGGLAAAVTIMARDSGGPVIHRQVLNYPWLYPASQDWPSYDKFATGYLLERSDLDWFARQYMSRPEDRSDPRANPFLTPDLSGLPPALLLTAQFDMLHDEGAAYAERLRLAGNRVQYSEYPGMVHGFFSMDGLLKETRKAWLEVSGFIRGEGNRPSL